MKYWSIILGQCFVSRTLTEAGYWFFSNEAYYANLIIKIVFCSLWGIIEVLILLEIYQSATLFISLYIWNASKNKLSFVVTPANHGILRVNRGEKNKWGAIFSNRSSIYQLKPTACHCTPTRKCKRLWVDFWNFMLLTLYSKHTNKNSGFFMLFKTIEKAYNSDKKKKRNVHYVYNTFLYKTMAIFFL